MLRRGFSTSRSASAAKSYLFSSSKRFDEASKAVTKPAVLPQFVKKFADSTIYDPFDFSMTKLKLDKKLSKESHSKNSFDVKKLNPLDYYTNPKYLSNYLTSTGRILSRDVTKLSLKNQKRLAKSIKRSRSAGLLSSVHQYVEGLAHTKKI